MSMGGCYISITDTKLSSLLSNHESLSDYVFNSGENPSTCSLEQAWDAFRVLFEHIDIDIYGEPLEADLGEGCFLIKGENLSYLSKDLNSITIEGFNELIQHDNFQNAEFYWDEFWKKKEEVAELTKIFSELQQFIKTADENKQAVIFYIA